MKISELIKELQAVKRAHGDLDVYGGNPDQGTSYEVSSAQECHEYGDSDKWCQVFSYTGPYCRECGRGCD